MPPRYYFVLLACPHFVLFSFESASLSCCSACCSTYSRLMLVTLHRSHTALLLSLVLRQSMPPCTLVIASLPCTHIAVTVPRLPYPLAKL